MKRIEPKERLAYLIQRAEKKARPWSAKKRDRFYAELMKTIALVPEMAADARITHLQVESIARQLERLLKLLEADLARRKES